MCCGSWGRKELDTTERLNGTELTRMVATLKLQGQARQHVKKERQRFFTFANKGPSSESYGFSNSHVWM